MGEEKETKIDEVEETEPEAEETENKKEGGMPEWAKKLQNKMEELEEKLNQNPPKEEEKDPVVLIPEPVREEPTPEEIQDEEPTQPTKREKFNNFLNWLK